MIITNHYGVLHTLGKLALFDIGDRLIIPPGAESVDYFYVLVPEQDFELMARETLRELAARVWGCNT